MDIIPANLNEQQREEWIKAYAEIVVNVLFEKYYQINEDGSIGERVKPDE